MAEREFIQQLGERFPSEAQNIRAFFAEILGVYREMYADMEKTGGAPRGPARPPAARRGAT